MTVSIPVRFRFPTRVVADHGRLCRIVLPRLHTSGALEPQPRNNLSTRSEAIVALLAIVAGFGIGYALLLATGNVAVGIGSAAPIAVLVNNFARNILR